MIDLTKDEERGEPEELAEPPVKTAGDSSTGLHDIHEAPAVAKTSGDTLAAGHVVTVEPGVYIPSQGGVRVEDTVVVTNDGCQILTLSPKALSPEALSTRSR